MPTRLRDVLIPLITLATGASLACGGAAESDPTTPKADGGLEEPKGATTMPERVACIDLASNDRYAKLTLGGSIDGVALYSFANTLDEPDASPPMTTLPALGVPCGTATDRPSCEEKISAALAARGTSAWGVVVAGNCGGCAAVTVRDFGVQTKGDAVTAIATLDALIAAAAPIESLQEAMTVLTLRGYRVDCDTNNARQEGADFVFRYIARRCDGEAKESLIKVSRLGEVSTLSERVLVPGQNNCIEGRRPAGLAATGVAWLSSVEACFAEIAHMEAAAVIAFTTLAHDLERHRAPRHLLARIERARLDEVVHARHTEALARRFGRSPEVPHVAPRDKEPSLFDLALDNAVEGCVRETYGALVAAFQGQRAAEPEVRAIFQRIAEEESDHAELSFALDAWYQSQLSVAERAAIQAAKDKALDDLALECMHEPHPDVVRIAGIPTSEEATRLLRLVFPYAANLLRAA